MGIATYAELKSAIADWLNRGDLTTVIPSFIALAEAELNRSLRTRDMIRRATASLEARFIELPADTAELFNVRLTGEKKPMTVKTPEQIDFLRELFDATGKPQHYAIVGSTLEVLPEPAQAYTIELSYYERVKALSESNVSNWLLVKHPDAYLYGSLMQSAPYLKDDARVELWAGGFDRVMTSIRLEEERMRYSGSTPVARIKAIT